MFAMFDSIFSLFRRGAKPATERRRMQPAGPCPGVGASIVNRGIVMRVTQPVSDEFWDWLVRSGWRELRIACNRRKYVPAPAGAFERLAGVSALSRKTLYRSLFGAMPIASW